MKYYLLGIGGVSMSALAILLKNFGHEVDGYDEKSSHVTKSLQDGGIDVDFCLNKDKINCADIIVFSSAFKTGNPIFDYAKSLNKKVFCRGKLLGEISNRYEKTIAVAGAHGKTTVTSMIFEVLKCAGKNPTLHLGGFRRENNKNYYIGDSEYFVTEACEYCDNFLYLYPYLSVVTNVEKEHLDYFKTFENEKKSFRQFKNQSIFVVDDISNFSTKKIRHKKGGQLCFDLFRNDQKVFHLNLKICEEINVQNCMYAYKACRALGVPDFLIKLGLEKYDGVKTRFEKVNCPYFENVICDYAHHPTEISKAINSAKKIYKNKELVVVFQPHTYSRTKTLLNEFVEVFKNVHHPVFYKTYSAREKVEDGISAEEFSKILKKHNKNAIYFKNFGDLKQYLLNFKNKDIVLMFVGAGDLPQILHKNKFIS